MSADPAPRPPPARSPLRARRVASAVAIVVLGAPVGLLVAFAGAAALRYTFTLPLPISVVVSVLAALAVAGSLVRVGWRSGLPPLGVALTVALAAWLVVRMVVLLVLPAPFGLVTVGGGDFGHHLHIATQFAGAMPRVYVGFTAWHAAVWAFAHALDLASPVAASVTFHFAGGVLLIVAAVVAIAIPWRSATGVARLIGCAIAGVLLAITMERFGFAILHYQQAEGFVGPAFAFWLGALGLVVALAPVAPLARIAGLLGCVGLSRFIYGINLPDELLALAVFVVCTFAAPRLGDVASAAPPRWQIRLARAAAVLLVLVAVAAGVMLTRSWGKPGGLMPPSLAGRAQTLALGLVTALALLASGQSAAQRLGSWLGVLLAVPLAVVAAQAIWPQLPRAYYLWKHGERPEMLTLVAAPAAAGQAVARLFAGVTAWRQAGPRAPRRVVWRRAVVAIALTALALGAAEAGRRANPRLVAGYRERSDPKVAWRQIEPLWDAGAMRAAWQLRAQGWQVLAVLHPHWPVANVLASALDGWAVLPPAPIVTLQERRWRLFADGVALHPGACVVFAAAPHRVSAWRQHDQIVGGVAGHKILKWLAEPGVRCGDDPPLADHMAAERTCWICAAAEPSRPASAEVGR